MCGTMITIVAHDCGAVADRLFESNYGNGAVVRGSRRAGMPAPRTTPSVSTTQFFFLWRIPCFWRTAPSLHQHQYEIFFRIGVRRSTTCATIIGQHGMSYCLQHRVRVCVQEALVETR